MLEEKLELEEEITLQEALNAFKDDEGKSLLSSLNDSEEGFKIDLAAETTKFFLRKIDFDDTFYIRVECAAGASKVKPLCTSFEFDGECWSDWTYFEPGTPGFHAQIKEFNCEKAYAAMQKLIEEFSPEIHERIKHTTHLLRDSIMFEIFFDVQKSIFVQVDEHGVTLMGPPDMTKRARKECIKSGIANPTKNEVARVLVKHALRG